MSQITYKELEAALNRCMKAHPPVAPEFVMHEDANAMSDVFVTMVMSRGRSDCSPIEVVSRDQMKPRFLEAFDRWTEAGAQPAG